MSLSISLSISLSSSVGRRGSVANPITILGEDLVAWWTADDAASMTLSGAQVTSWRDQVAGYDMVQAVSAARPVYSATGLNGSPCVTADGTDDELTITPAPSTFPDSGEGGEFWFITDQAVAAASAGVRFAASYGDGLNTRRAAGRTVSGGVNRGDARAGTGFAETILTATDGNFSGRCLVRTRFTASSVTFQLPDVSTESSAAVALAGTALNRARLFASPNSTASAFWLGSHRDFILTLPLSADKSSALTAWALPRRNL